jgi:hypothetical protein
MSKNATSICRRTAAAIITLTSSYAAVKAKGWRDPLYDLQP